MNLLELLLVACTLAICQQFVFSFKEGLFGALVEKEKDRVGKWTGRNGKHLDLNAIGGFLNKVISDVAAAGRQNKNNTSNAGTSGNNGNVIRQPSTDRPFESNQPYPTQPPHRPHNPSYDARPPTESFHGNRPDFERQPGGPPYGNAYGRPHNRPDYERPGNRPDYERPGNRPEFERPPYRPENERPPPYRPENERPNRPEYGRPGGPPYNKPHPPPYNPNANPNPHNPAATNGERCATPNGEQGFCRLVEDCPIKPIISDYANFLKYSCTIGKHGVGVCCPANYRGEEKPRPSTARPTSARPQTPKPTGRPNNTPKPTAKPTPKPTPRPSGRRSLIDEAKQDCGYSPKTRIVGGKESKKDAWPWAIPIFRASSYKDQFCGGALITRRHVLTASHCMTKVKAKDIFVRVGAYNIQEEDENDGAYNVVKISSHKQYDNKTNANDITVLTLDRDVPFNANTNPVCIPEDSDDYTKQNATVIGWGTTSYEGTSSSVLQEVSVPVWALKDCQNVYGKEKITDKQICAGLKQGGKDSCQGDSGGPLLKLSTTRRRFEVIGVVSYGFRCAEANNPGVYTRVNRYYKWLQEETTL